MPINASLFAHIQNDSSLSGTYALEGNRFTNTVAYLHEYLDLIADKELISSEYQVIKEQTKELLNIEQEMDALSSSINIEQGLRELSTKTLHKIHRLSPKERVLLPGGWHNSDGGHALIYQFTRHPDGYHFTLFNAGAGLGYHAKKSRTDKELYNPTKTWHIPFPQTPIEEKEFILFLESLFKARLPYQSKYQKKPIDHKVLYEEILSTISYINGREIAGDTIPEHGFTAGQLSLMLRT